MNRIKASSMETVSHRDSEYGPAQEPEKKMEEPMKEEAKKPEEKKKDTEEEVKSFPPYYHQPSYYHQQPRQYLIRSVEEDPNA
ncbi:hypothetical protein RJ640_014209 [Escallonia rubra]|uniref:Uncharacterized protein n=1 Tax=Escallonia rubra TaxID=112253 RepID=A0AA88RNK4_9ASTE|nr:hypothetical protein RJ640_014209 [Escallonia rubra]